MMIYRKLSAIWKEDTLLRRVVVNTSYLLSGNVLASFLGFVQSVIAVRLLGITGWGLLTIIMTFASNVNRLLSFRMSEVVVKRVGTALAQDDRPKAAALIKVIGLTEAATSVAAFLVLVLLTPLASVLFAKNPSTSPWFLLYGLILLSNLVYETSTGVLQVTRRFDHLARVNVVQSIVTLVLTVIVYILYRLMGARYYSPMFLAILMIEVIGRTYVGVALVVLALRELRSRLGVGWWQTPLAGLTEKRSLLLFALNTNLNGTVNLIFRDNIPLYLAFLLSTTQVGYFKLAMTLIGFLTLILDPLIGPTYTEIAQTLAHHEWETTLRLIRRITLISTAVVGAIAAFWSLTGWWLIPLVYKAESRPVYPVLLVLLLGYGFAEIFQWNRPLMLSLGKAGYPVLVSILVGVVELGLIFSLVPRYGYLCLAAILSGYFILSLGFVSGRGILEVHRLRKAMA
jgi:O-antigen/teichoic acid export membrane protein